MSTVLYGALTERRNTSAPRESTKEKTGINTYVDALAALVPVEVLALHAAILELTTTSEEGEGGEDATTITEPGTLEWVFWALLGLSVVLYVLGLRHRPVGWGWLRLAIPPLALLGWMLVQNPSAFDVVDPGLGSADKAAIAAIGAVLLGALAALLGQWADRTRAVDYDWKGQELRSGSQPARPAASSASSGDQ
jgi:hypothetical protein